MKVFLNGRIVGKNDALVSVFDRGFVYGDGIYETMLAKNSNIFRLDEHLDRLKNSARLLDIKLPFSKKFFSDACYKVLRANRLESARVRIEVTRGVSELSYNAKSAVKPTVVVIVSEFKVWPDQYYRNGVDVAISGVRRNNKYSLDPSIKSSNCLNQILAAQEAKKRGAFEAIMLNTDGFVAEGTISNVFAAKNGVLFTPNLNTGILDGVTRQCVINLAKSEKVKFREIYMRPAELFGADECFITSSTLEVMPVATVDGKKIGCGRPGFLTVLLGEWLKNLIEAETLDREDCRKIIRRQVLI
jgi:branched-chain amino acid aminotransferase